MGNEFSVLSPEKDETNMCAMIVHDLIHITVFYYINVICANVIQRHNGQATTHLDMKDSKATT